MGVYLGKPRTEKESSDGGDTSAVAFGVTAMQGWRQSMEDAHIHIPDFQPGISLFGVFDGHGGSAVSKWISLNLEACLTAKLKEARKKLEDDHIKVSDAFLKCLPEETAREATIAADALEATFFQLDIDMQTPESRAELFVYHGEAEQKRREADEATQDDGGNKSLGGSSGMFLQELLGARTDGSGKPMIRIVEHEGKHYVQLMGDGENDSGDDDEDIEGSDQEDDDKDIIESLGGLPSSDPSRIEILEELDDAEEADSETGDAADTEQVDDATRQVVEDSKHSTEKLIAGSDSEDDEHIPAVAAKDEEEDAEMYDLDEPIGKLGGLGDENSLSANNTATEEMEDKIEKLEPHRPECCGATAVVVLVFTSGPQPFIITANCGDSRSVLARNCLPVALSEDHKPQNPLETARIKKAGGAVIGGRVDGNLNLSRSLGDLFYKKDTSIPPQAQKITAFPDIRVTSLTGQEDFAVLACDGIWDCLDNTQVVRYVARRLAGLTPDDSMIQSDNEPSLREKIKGNRTRLSGLCEEMCDRCLASNPFQSEGIGCDNMTAMVARFSEELITAAERSPAGQDHSLAEVLFYVSPLHTEEMMTLMAESNLPNSTSDVDTEQIGGVNA